MFDFAQNSNYQITKFQMHGVISNGYIFKSPSLRFREALTALYTFDNPAYLDAVKFSPYAIISDAIPKTRCFVHWDEDTRELDVPRGFAPTELSPELAAYLYLYDFKRKQCKSPVEFPKLQITLNTEQKAMLQAFRKARKDGSRPAGAFLFESSTSTGKTIMQAVAASRTGQRTLVLCATNLIRDAWLRDIYTAFGIPAREVGLIQREKWRIGEHFTLGSIATIDRRYSRWKEIYETFGTIVLDEAHIASEPRVYAFLRESTSRYLIGATATVQKEGDTLNQALWALFGKPIHTIQTHNVDTSSSMALRKVRVVRTDFEYDYDTHNLDLHDLSITMAADEDRNKLIVENAVRDWRSGHSVVVATNRVPHVLLLVEMLREAGVKDTNPLYGAVNARSGYSMKLVKLFNARKVRMIVANIQAIKLGANMNPLDRLHLVFPPNGNDLKQLIGRIRRKAAGKKDSELVYYLDGRVLWAVRRFNSKAVPLFRDMNVPGFENMF